MCKYCHGRGCLYCPPPPKPEPGPQLIASFRTDDPADMELAAKAIGASALQKAFGPGGGGAEEIINNCREATLHQVLRRAVFGKEQNG